MATTLDQLLSWAARGLRVFPIQENGKRPLPDTHGLDDATSDPATITAWFNTNPRYNWAVNCGASGISVLDIDVKPSKKFPAGTPGFASLEDLTTLEPMPDTFTVDTPSGGRHYYFRGVAPTSASKLGVGLDTRGLGGYVLLPGSSLDGKEYTIRTKAKLAEMPKFMAALGAPVDRTAEPVKQLDHVTIDGPDNVTRATELLLALEPAIEGLGGDAHTLQVAMRVKDCGISEERALDLMSRFWNHRCQPPWDIEDLERKVRNAFAYGQNPVGSDAPPPAPNFAPVPQPKVAPLSVTADTFEVSELPPRPWILGHQLIEGFITATVAKGGVGKSTLTLAETLAVATGRPITGDPVTKPGAVWVYNTEDPLDELKRRVLAAAQHHGVSKAELARVHVSSGRTAPLILAKTESRIPRTCQGTVDAVIAHIKEHDIRVWCVDPFVHTHYCDENSNAEIAVVMLAFSQIAEATGCAISLVHHATKGAGGEGEMDKARGASAFGGAVRIMRTVTGMTEEDAKTYNVPTSERKWFLRLDDAKGNMSPPADEVRWFRKQDVVLSNGDHVGTVSPAALTPVEVDDYGPLVTLAISCADCIGSGMMTDEFAKAVEARDTEHVLRSLGRKKLAPLLEELFSGAGGILAPGVGHVCCDAHVFRVRPFEMNGGEPWDA